MNNDDDEIIFDRDTSKPKEKLKKRKRRKEKEKTEQNITDSNINKNLNNTVDINKINQTEKNNNTKKEENDFNNIQNINLMKSDNNINNEKEKSKNDDLVNFDSKEKNAISSNLETDEINKKNINANFENDNNKLNNNENNNMQSSEDLTNNNNYVDKNINVNNRYNDENSETNQIMASTNKDKDYNNSQSNNTNSKFLNSSKNYIYDNNISTSLSDKEKLEKEYQDALNSGDRDKIIKILQRKVEYYELYINNLNLLIQHLRNDIHKKEKIMHLLTDTNTQMKKALNNFSKQLDKKLIEVNNTTNKNKAYKNSKSTIKLIDTKNGFMEEGKNINSELSKALARNRLLQKDNDNLKNLLDMTNNAEKIKEQENLNKTLKEENAKLEDEIHQIKRDLVEHSYCEKKRESLLEKIKYLTEDNKQLKKQIRKLTLENQSSQDNLLNMTKMNMKKMNLNDKNKNDFSSGQNNLNTTRSRDYNKKSKEHLPKITIKSKKEENNKKDNEIEHLIDKEEIYILIQLFQGDESKFSEFKKKLISYAKCKESIINKYKADEKLKNKKVYSMQEEIEYLNHKVKESEMRINIFQQQINDKDFKNKKLKKQLIKEKKEKENTAQKFNDFKKINEKIILNNISKDNHDIDIKIEDGVN